MKKKANVDYKLNLEGCIRLACAIAEYRSEHYRDAYREYLIDPSKKNLSDVKFFERKLKSPPTLLESGQIKRLQRQVRESMSHAPT